MRNYNLGFISDENIFSLFQNVGNGWTVSTDRFDLANEGRHIYSFIRPDAEKMSDRQMRYLMIKMFDKVIKDKDAHCYVVDLNAPSQLDAPWTYKADGQTYWHERLHHTSIATFLDLAFGNVRQFRPHTT